MVLTSSAILIIVIPILVILALVGLNMFYNFVVGIIRTFFPPRREEPIKPDEVTGPDEPVEKYRNIRKPGKAPYALRRFDNIETRHFR